MTTTLKTTTKGEAFPHRELWRTARRLFLSARSQSEGSGQYDMAAVLMSFLALGAYLNLLISKVDPVVWQKERKHFSGPNYWGTLGKLEWLAEQCSGFTFDRSARPYQTVYVLRDVRNRLAHAKPYTFEKETQHRADEDPDKYPESAFQEINEGFSAAVEKDVEAVIEELHEAARDLHDDPWLKAKALGGPLGYASSSTEIVK